MPGAGAGGRSEAAGAPPAAPPGPVQLAEGGGRGAGLRRLFACVEGQSGTPAPDRSTVTRTTADVRGTESDRWPTYSGLRPKDQGGGLRWRPAVS